MKTKFFLLGAVTLAGFAFSAAASDALLSPRALENQITKSPAANVTVAAPATAPAVRVVMSPRAADNQIVKVSGNSNEVNPATVCTKKMTGSPKAIAACLENPKAMAACQHTNVSARK
jgi:hypothetical protein